MPEVDLVIALCATLDCNCRSAQMEDPVLQALHRRGGGIAIHRMLHGVTVLRELPDRTMQRQAREFGGFRRDCRALADWLKDCRSDCL